MPDVIDLRDESSRAIESFADESEAIRAAGTPSRVIDGTLTYERHYGLREKPFSLSTDPRFLYRSASHAPVLRDLAAAIRRREGLIVLTGDIGTGKTTLCRAVLAQLDRKTFATFVPDPFVTREDLLKMMLIDFGVMSVEDLVKGRLKGASRPDLSYPLYEFLQSLERLDAFAVLVIDEAQNLSLPLLEEIRILSDLEVGRKLLQVVLVGQPEFDEQLRLPRMRQIEQRVSVHCELKPLDRDGLSGYVSHRLQTAGAASSQLRVGEDALDVVFAATGGVPRVVNLVCDKAFAHGERAGTFLVGADLVCAALVELRLAPPLPVTTTMPAELPPTPAIEAVATATSVPDTPAAVPVPVESAPPVEPPVVESSTPSGLDALLDLPAVDLKVQLEDRAERPARRPPPSAVPVTRGKVWHGTPRLGPIAATALVVLGATTGVSLVGYWLWLRPLLLEPRRLPHVEPPPVVVALRLPPAALDVPGGEAAASPPGSVPSVATQAGASVLLKAVPSGTWAIQTGAFSGEKRASVLQAHLTELGYPAFQRDIEFSGRGAFRVVLVGPFASREDADAALPRLRAVPGLEQSITRRLLPQ